jgi:hypothetical protein
VVPSTNKKKKNRFVTPQLKMETTQREQIADESEQQQQQQQQQPERPLAEYLRKLEERAKEKRTTGEKDDSEEEEDEEPRRYIIGDREVELPRSVIHLKSRNGGDVFLIGSAHVSQASVDDVTQVRVQHTRNALCHSPRRPSN